MGGTIPPWCKKTARCEFCLPGTFGKEEVIWTAPPKNQEMTPEMLAQLEAERNAQAQKDAMGTHDGLHDLQGSAVDDDKVYSCPCPGPHEAQHRHYDRGVGLPTIMCPCKEMGTKESSTGCAASLLLLF